MYVCIYGIPVCKCMNACIYLLGSSMYVCMYVFMGLIRRMEYWTQLYI